MTACKNSLYGYGRYKWGDGVNKFTKRTKEEHFEHLKEYFEFIPVYEA